MCDLFMTEALVAAEAESGLLLGCEAGDGIVDSPLKLPGFQPAVGRRRSITEILQEIAIVGAVEDFLPEVVEDKIAGGDEQIAFEPVYFREPGPFYPEVCENVL